MKIVLLAVVMICGCFAPNPEEGEGGVVFQDLSGNDNSRPPVFDTDSDADTDSDSDSDTDTDTDSDSVDTDSDSDTDSDMLVNWYYDADGDKFGDPDQVTTLPQDQSGPAGHVLNNNDCEDSNSDINPDAEEVCDEVDNDCDALIDDADSNVGGESSWWLDSDGDGYGDALYNVRACLVPTGYVDNETDCDDTLVDYHELTTYYFDGDGDNFGDADHTSSACGESLYGYVEVDSDCDDSNPNINPDADEVCDGEDNDCDILIDSSDDSVTGELVWYQDLDVDGFGDPDQTKVECEEPISNLFVLVAGDCDDGNAYANPDAEEVCDEVDNDCDSRVDEDLSQFWYKDLDGDGYGLASMTKFQCEEPSDYADQLGDCEDGDDSINPGAIEICDDLDNDCDGLVDDDDDNILIFSQELFYMDSDGDSYGDPDKSMYACEMLVGYTDNGNDCDDESNSRYPGADESCNEKDDDCDGLVDENLDQTWYKDVDGDGVGGATTSVECAQPGSEYVLAGGDCDDGNSSYQSIVTYYQDADKDSFGNDSASYLLCADPILSTDVTVGGDCADLLIAINPDADEICDGIDNDCNGQMDENCDTGGMEDTSVSFDSDTDVLVDTAQDSDTDQSGETDTGAAADTSALDSDSDIVPSDTDTANANLDTGTSSDTSDTAPVTADADNDGIPDEDDMIRAAESDGTRLCIAGTVFSGDYAEQDVYWSSSSSAWGGGSILLDELRGSLEADDFYCMESSGGIQNGVYEDIRLVSERSSVNSANHVDQLDKNDWVYGAVQTFCSAYPEESYCFFDTYLEAYTIGASFDGTVFTPYSQ